MDNLIIKVIAGYYAFVGILALILSLVIAAVGLSLPFSMSVVPMGVLGVAVANVVWVVPLIVAVFALILAYGLWEEQSWALWITVGLNGFAALVSLALILIVSVLTLPPILGQAMPSTWNLVPGLVINVAVVGGLLYNRGEFS